MSPEEPFDLEIYANKTIEEAIRALQAQFPEDYRLRPEPPPSMIKANAVNNEPRVAILIWRFEHGYRLFRDSEKPKNSSLLDLICS